MSTNDANPGTFLGGTWERIKDTFLMCKGDTYTSSGGASTASITGSVSVANHTLTSSEIPSHRHSVNITTSATGSWGMTFRHLNDGKDIVGDGYGVTIQNDYTATTYNQIGTGINAYSGHTTRVTTGAHSHSVSGNTAYIGGGSGHNHTATFSGDSISIIPTYIAVYVWKRTA